MKKLLIIDTDPRFVAFLKKLCEKYSIQYYPETEYEEEVFHAVLARSVDCTRSETQIESSKECLRYLVQSFFGEETPKKMCLVHCDVNPDTEEVPMISFCEESFTNDVFVLFVARTGGRKNSTHDIPHIVRKTSRYNTKIRKSSFIHKTNALFKQEVEEVIKTFLED